MLRLARRLKSRKQPAVDAEAAETNPQLKSWKGSAPVLVSTTTPAAKACVMVIHLRPHSPAEARVQAVQTLAPLNQRQLQQVCLGKLV